LVGALAVGLLLCLAAVLAAAWRAGRVPPAEALREQRVGRQGLGIVRVTAGLAFIGGGIAMVALLSGYLSLVFGLITVLLFAAGVALLAPLTIGGPAAALARPLRLLPGALGLLASTALSSSRGRAGAIGIPIVLVTVLVGTGVLVQQAVQGNIDHVTGERVTAQEVIVPSAGSGLAPSTAATIRGLAGVSGATAAMPTQLFLLAPGLTNAGNPRQAVGLDGGRAGATPGLDLGVRAGSLASVHGDVIALSYEIAAPAGLRIGDLLQASMYDLSPLTLRIGAIYNRAAGLGDIVLDPALAQAHAVDKLDNAIYVTGGPQADQALARYARAHPEVTVLSRAQFLSAVHGGIKLFAVWIVAGVAALFAAVSLVNTVAMTTAVRSRELASIRLIGGTPRQCLELITLESAITVVVALAIGSLIVWLSLLSVPVGPTGMPVSGSYTLIAIALGAIGLLGIAAGALAGVGALRVPPATSIRVQG
jgi:putative ABC transport system permease protein